jgi:hypothetical protein
MKQEINKSWLFNTISVCLVFGPIFIGLGIGIYLSKILISLSISIGIGLLTLSIFHINSLYKLIILNKDKISFTAENNEKK